MGQYSYACVAMYIINGYLITDNYYQKGFHFIPRSKEWNNRNTHAVQAHKIILYSKIHNTLINWAAILFWMHIYIYMFSAYIYIHVFCMFHACFMHVSTFYACFMHVWTFPCIFHARLQYSVHVSCMAIHFMTFSCIILCTRPAHTTELA